MNAVLRDSRRLLPLVHASIDAVLAIERAAYEFPWSRANFIDSLAAGHACQLLCDGQGSVLGYWVALAGVEEMHLLNLTVTPSAQGQGHALFMLEALVALCRRLGARQLWLEVRQSNLRARRIYARFGFANKGLRKGYYPAALGRREDAVVMGLAVLPPLAQVPHALD
jgi:[ribosomal protein S18]-alanine N-acetyltransferase